MGILAAGLGAALIAVALADLFVTVLTTRGGGPISARLSTWSWRALLKFGAALGTRRHLGYTGPLMAVLAMLGWMALFWVGWTLVFSAAPDHVVRATTGEPADVWARAYFTGYTFFTLGLGDYRPEGGLWQILTTLTAANGFIVISLSASYLIPLVSAATAKRSTALQIGTLGETPEAMLAAAWDGSGFPGLSQQLAGLVPPIIQAGQQHLAYPVLHHFQSVEPAAALPVQIARLDEALLLLELGVAPEGRLPVAVTIPLAAAIGRFLDVLERSQIRSTAAPPPAPDLGALRRAGVTLVPEAEFSAALEARQERRRRLAGLVRDSGWSWIDLRAGPR